MDKPLLDGRREAYCLNVVAGRSGGESARLAGYCPKNPKNAYVMSWYLLKYLEVRERIAWLRKAAADEAIATLTQRKVILSQMADSNLADYFVDGRLDPFRADVPNPHAIASVDWGYDPIHKKPVPVGLRLHDKIRAIHDLNLLEASYKQIPTSRVIAPGVTVSIEENRIKIVENQAEDVSLEEGKRPSKRGDREVAMSHQSSRPQLAEGRKPDNAPQIG